MASSPAPPARRLSLRKKLGFGLLTTLLFFLALEAALAIFNYPPPKTVADPWVGFSKLVPLFAESVDDEDREIWATRDEKLVWFNDQTFSKEKAPRAKRLFSLGGSTTYGRPYRDPTSFNGWLRAYLQAAAPNQTWEAVNAGGVSYASYRVVNIMEELANYEPDLFIVYSAHNEFLERRTYAQVFEHPTMHKAGHLLSRTKTWQLTQQWLGGKTAKTETPAGDVDVLPEEVDEILNHTVGPTDYHRDLEWQQKVVQHYRWNLNRMVDIAEQCGAKLVFVSPASNESGCAPFKSEFASETSAADQQSVLRLLSLAQQQLTDAPDKPEAAITSLRQAMRIDSQYAEIHYWLGRALLANREPEAAQRAFQAAIDLDVCPLRATTDIRDALREVAKARQVPVVDLDAILRSAGQQDHPVLGEAEFLDHVHPTMDGHRQLALALLEKIRSENLLPVPELTAAAQQQAEAAVADQIDDEEHGVALRNLAKVLHWAGKFREAKRNATQALQKLPDDPESMFLLADCRKELGEIDLAFGAFHELLVAHPNYDRARIPFGVMFYQSGDYPEAQKQLTLGLLAFPENAQGHYWLGASHLAMGEYKEAEESLQRALEIAPRDPGTLFAIAESMAGQGRVDDARDRLNEVLELVPNHPNTLCALADLDASEGKTAQAIQRLEALLDVNPDFAPASERLELLRSESP